MSEPIKIDSGLIAKQIDSKAEFGIASWEGHIVATLSNCNLISVEEI